LKFLYCYTKGALRMERNTLTLDEEAESICRWGAARAGVIVVVPVAGVIALMANEVYMIIRIAGIYGVKINESAATAFIGAMGGAFVGQALALMIPFPPMQIPIAIGVTYAIGKTAQAWIRDGMPADMTKYKDTFESFKAEAKNIVNELSIHPFKSKPLGDEKRDFSR